ncbi:MAG: YceI family protein [Bacteroidia bacterium]|nr:YceI family protein [Bacteroidia bacterium]
MKKTLLILTVSTGLLFAACGNPDKGNTVDTETEGEAAEATVESVSYAINTESSTVQWTGRKVLDDSHTGTINITDGSLTAKEGVIESGSFTIDMKSFTETDNDNEEMVGKLVGHLMSADFFNVDTFPTAKFEVTEGGADMIKGNLTIKDITKQIEIPVTTEMTDAGLNASSEFTINRNDWGVTWGNGSTHKIDFLKDNVIKDEIEFSVNLVATK